MSMLIGDKVVVSIHYTLTGEEGEVIDSSEGNDPLTYLHGTGNIIPGLESELTGKAVGAAFKVDIEPEDAYGAYNKDFIQSVPKDMFQDVDEVEVGMQFHAQGPNGSVQMVTVTAVGDEDVTVDANHPLAGKKLSFDVTVEAVREATAEEIEHGHVH